MKRFKVDDDIFNVRVWVMTDCPQSEFAAWVKKKYKGEIEPESGDGGEFTSIETKNGVAYCLWIEKMSKSWTTLNHELIHCAITILEDRKISINSETEEVFAYYHTFLAKKIFNKLGKFIIK